MRPLVLSILFFLVIGCKPQPVSRKEVILDTTISQCQRNRSIEELSRWEYVLLKRDTPTSIALQQNITQDCCARYVFSLKQEGNLLQIYEKNIGFSCKVAGGYEVNGFLLGLDPSQQYTVEVWQDGRRLQQQTL